MAITKKDGLDIVKIIQKFENGERMTTQECTNYLILVKMVSAYSKDAENILRDHAPTEGKTYTGEKGTAQVSMSTSESFDSEKARVEYPQAYMDAVRRQMRAGKLAVSSKFFDSKTVVDACTKTKDCTAKVIIKLA